MKVPRRLEWRAGGVLVFAAMGVVGVRASGVVARFMSKRVVGDYNIIIMVVS